MTYNSLPPNNLSLLFADDTTIVTSSTDITLLYNRCNSVLRHAEDWFVSNHLTLNAKKTKFIVFSSNKHIHHSTLKFGNVILERIGSDCPTKNFKFLGHILDDKLVWDDHISHVIKK